MYTKEDLVYNKHDGRLVGFTNLGDINNHLTRFEQQIESNNSTPALAKTIVAFMVKDYSPLYGFVMLSSHVVL